MTPWQTWVAVLGGAGVVGALVQLGRGVWGWWTGASGRKVAAYRSAITAMGEASRWADLYYHYRQWCVEHHGCDDADYPAPTEDMLSD